MAKFKDVEDGKSVSGWWMAAVEEGERAFMTEASWAALSRSDPELYGRMQEQRRLWGEAIVTGSDRDVAEHGAAMVRGLEVCLNKARLAATAKMAGVARGKTVAIVERLEDARDLEPGLVVMTIDELEELVKQHEALRTVVAVKKTFSGARVVETA